MTPPKMKSEQYGKPIPIQDLQRPSTIQTPRAKIASEIVQAKQKQILENLKSPLELTNRYTNIPRTTGASSSSQQNDPQYVEKPFLIPFMVIEKEWISLPRHKIIEQIFPKDYHFIPTSFNKKREFYELILVDTNSIDLTHNKDEKGQITFSKLKILQVLSPQDWNGPFYKFKQFSVEYQPPNYNYFDYIDAWANMLMLRPATHSWFFWIDKNISLQFPSWFVKWFNDFGPIIQIFPQEVKQSFELFCSLTNFIQDYKLIAFVASQGISWITMWEYDSALIEDCTIMQYLVRKIKVKWWNKYDTKHLKPERLKEWAIKYKSKKQPRIQTSTSKIEAHKESQFLAEKTKMMAALAQASSEKEVQQILKTMSTSSQDKEEEDEEVQSSPDDFQNEDDCYGIFDPYPQNP